MLQERNKPRGRIVITFLALAAAEALAISSGVHNAAAQSVFKLSATDVTIMAPDSEQIIGQGHYKLSHVDALDVVEGENKYLNGEYDREEQSVQPSVGGL